MPVYEYRCTQCQKIFEYQQRMADAPRTECEECKGQLERLISRSSFAFKGGGWYKDLYSSTKPEAGTSTTPSSTSSETKTETKTETKSSDAGSSSGGSTSTPSTPSTGGGSSGSGSTSSSAA